MNNGIKYNQQDVVLIPFPYSDLTGAKQRPALILSNSKLKGEDVICCLITSKESEDCILLGAKDCEEGKLPFLSYIKCYRLFTIHKNIIKKRICKVNEKLFDCVISEIAEYVKRA